MCTKINLCLGIGTEGLEVRWEFWYRPGNVKPKPFTISEATVIYIYMLVATYILLCSVGNIAA